MSDVNTLVLEPLAEFVRDSKHLVQKCTKPDKDEFARVARATGIGSDHRFIGFENHSHSRQ